jgi:hypothetical protein
MIYFLTDWQSEMTRLESNVLFNVNKIFNEGGIETKMINTRFSPFSNYFTNHFEFYDSDHFINLMDSVTDQFSLCHAPLTFKDLEFPKSWEKVYTRNNVLLTKEGEIKAEVFFNSFGFVSQVHYHSSLGKEINIYSEKGMILLKQKFNIDGEQVEQQVFDEGGQLIFTEWNEYVFIENHYKSHFKKSNYHDFKEVCMELVNSALVNFNPEEDRLIIDGTSEWLMGLIEGFEYPESIVYIFTGPTEDCISQLNRHNNFIERGKCVVTDNILFQDALKKSDFYPLKNKFRFMPLYSTILTLGESSTYLEEYIYWQIEQFDFQIDAVLQKFLLMKLEIRDLCLIIDIKKEEDQEPMKKLLKNFVVKNFEVTFTSPEYELVKKYYEALRNEEMTAGLQELFQKAKKENEEFSRVIESYLFYTGITFKKNATFQELKMAFQKVRVFIDQREKHEFLSHSLAVSAGIPLLSKKPSPYLINGKNGILYKKDKQLIDGVKSYLSDYDLWNKNLVESVELIESNSANGLLEKWKENLK